jgi:hypothetical protein
MKLILIIFSLLLFAGCLIAKLSFDVSPFWNGFVLSGMILSPVVSILYTFNIIRTHQQHIK